MDETTSSLVPVLASMAFALPLIIVWSMIWKGIALWKSARLGHKGWFVALLIINTVGILEIIYIYAIAKKLEKTPVELPKA